MSNDKADFVRDQTVPAGQNAGAREPHLIEALAPIVAMFALLGVGYGYLGYRIEPLLLASAVVTALVGWRLGYSWREMQGGIIEALAKAMPALFILIIIGALIASWIAAGIIPMLIYYGLELISPRLFLVTACVISSIVSVCTGTSWGTIGTIGVALIGVAEGLDVPPGAAAGAIVSGAYFGDKLSPFSDTTNLAPVIARSNLFDHIRWLLWTTGPAWGIGLLVYLIFGFSGAGTSPVDVSVLQDGLQAGFTFSIWLLLPPVVVLWFALRKRPIVPGLLAATGLAMILAMVFQGGSLSGLVEAIITGYVPATGVEEVDGLLERGGMQSMMDLTLLVIIAFGFAGIMTSCGLLRRILRAVLNVVRSRGGLVASTSATGVMTAFLTGSSHLSIIVPGELFVDAFRTFDLAAKNLSRTLEDSGTVVVPLVPWSAAGAFAAGSLGVATVEYGPWAIMNYLGVVFAVVFGFTGFALADRIREDETVPGS